MPKKVFVIGIGGTGMRCLESLVHLCAIGMFDDTEVEMLALDTDRENGNFRRLSNLIDAYHKAKGVDKEHYAGKQSFFTARINFYQFSPDYSRQDTSNFARIFKQSDMEQYERESADLAKLLFPRRTREFDLKHGYRAQTSLGSILMYNAIVSEVARNHQSQIAQFISNLVTASLVEKVKVFAMGSVFGGTGASSIPVIPKAFTAASRILTPGATLENVYFGASLLTSYFTFKNPSKEFLKNQQVVATADKFALNSQAAMMFYNEDSTVKKTYQQFYMLGTSSMDFQTDDDGSETVTGGERQQNDSHFIELFAASAAYNFFQTPLDELTRIKNATEGVRYYYRTIDDSEEFFFQDFVPPGDVEKFAKGLGLLTALSFINYEADFYAAAQSGMLARYNIFGFENIDSREIEGIKKYLGLFNFQVDGEKVKDGWLRQLQHSTQSKFVLKTDAFSGNSPRELNKFKYNKELYKDDFGKHAYGGSFWGANKYDAFREAFQAAGNDPTVTNTVERLTKRIYDSLCKLYNFSK